jgi:hypothetical protein
MLLPAVQFHFRGAEVAQTLLPFGLQSTCYQPIFGFYTPIANNWS